MVSKVTKGIIISFWLLFAIAVGAVVLLFSAIAKGSIGYMPPVEQLENPIDKYASQVVSADGKTLGIYAHSQDNRIMVNYNDLSPDLVKALIRKVVVVVVPLRNNWQSNCFLQVLTM